MYYIRMMCILLLFFHSMVQQHGVFIGRESDYDDLVLYIEDVETANVI